MNDQEESPKSKVQESKAGRHALGSGRTTAHAFGLGTLGLWTPFLNA